MTIKEIASDMEVDEIKKQNGIKVIGFCPEWYTSKAKLDIINNLQINDILIVKLDSVSAEKYVVIKITAIADAPGREFDTYTFSIKK